MRAQLTFILLLSLSRVAGAQHHASPIAGAVPELPPVGLPLPSIGLPHPPTGLPPLTTTVRPNGGRQTRRPGTVHYGSRRLPAAVYLVPAFVDSVSPLAPDVSAPSDPAPVGGRLRVEISPGVIGQVYLDGYYVGTTEDLSRAMDVTSGRHSIEIRVDGYQPSQDELAVAAGRSVTYRSALTRAPEPARAPPAAESTAPKTFYVIPGCYVGDIRPEENTVPAGCDPQRAIAVRR
jgi:PEGA domain